MLPLRFFELYPMSNITRNRVLHELKELQRDSGKDGFNVETDATNMFLLRATIKGPPDTPYEGGTYRLRIQIPDAYPFSAPKVNFETKVWHPNISSQSGAICLDILKDAWAAAMSIRTVLLSIQALLCSPEPDDPQDAVVAGQFKSNRVIFEKTARHWAHAYAQAPEKYFELQPMVERLMGMGFPETESRAALSSTNWDVTAALEYLLR